MQRLPKFESFFGDDKKNKLDFDVWETSFVCSYNPFWDSY